MNNSARYLKKQQRRAQHRLLAHVEKLGAAFCLETGLRASDTCVVSERREDGSVVQYFQARTYDDALSRVIEAARSLVAQHSRYEEPIEGLADLDEALAALQK